MKIARIINWLPAVIAACSLISLYAFTQIDAIVHQTLYFYGLQFSNDWAIPYWNIAGIAVAMGWLIVILAILFQIYLVIRKPLVNAGGVMQPESNEEERWSTFRLGDGSTIKVKLVVKGAKRLNKYDPDGMPIYTVDTENIVRVVNVPEKLKAPAS